jgi:hypothetical protein
MNYKFISGTLVYQKAKGCQWFEVPCDELVRLALIGINHESQSTQPAADKCVVCGESKFWHSDGDHKYIDEAAPAPTARSGGE